MSPGTQLGLYLVVLVVGSGAAAGLSVLWMGKVRRAELLFGASAGVMLGILGAHLLPEAFQVGPRAAWAVIAGFSFMLVVERFVVPHALHTPHEAEAHERCDPAVEHAHVRKDVAGLGAFFGLALHTIGDGLALGAVVDSPKALPYVFLAIFAHKMPSSFAVGSLLVRARVRPGRVVGAGAVLGIMVAVGAGLFLLASDLGRFDPHAVAPYAIAFAAGSFLHVVVTDLLPDLHHEGTFKRELILSFLGGLALIVLLSLLVRG